MMIKVRSFLVGLYLAVMFVYLGTHAYFIFVHMHSASDPGWYVENDRRVRLRGVWSEENSQEPSPLREGDEVTALDGRKFNGDLDRTRLFDSLRPGSAYQITVNRQGVDFDYTLHSVSLSNVSTAFNLAYRVLFPGIFLLIGLAVFLLKPDDKQAILLALLLGGTWASDPANYVVLSRLPLPLVMVLAAALVCGNLIPAIFLHLFLVFPERSALIKRWPRLEYFIYVLLVFGALPTTWLSAYWWVAGSPERSLTASEAYPTLELINNLFTLLYLGGGLGVLIYTYRRSGPLSRRKLKVVVVGTLAGVLPLIATFIVMILFSPSITKAWVIMVMTAFGSLMLIPFSFAYAIVRHQVIPISLIIRRSVQYLLAKQALRFTLALPFLGLAWSAYSNRHRTLMEIVFNNSSYLYLTAIAAAGLSLKFRRTLSNWIDRHFFREAYNQEKVLGELIDEVKQLDTMSEISRRVTEKVEQALHPELIHLFYRSEGGRDLTLNYSSGAQSPELRISEEFRLLRLMEDLGTAQDFPFAQKNNLPQTERDWLTRIGARLIVPMTGTDGRLAGLLLLGPKKAEMPYTARDRNLLESLADQIALLYENLHLKGRVERDRRMRREVLARLETQNINIVRECPVCGICYDGEQKYCPVDKAELTLPLPVERTIAGRYRLDRSVGRGGMGAVYEAMDLRLERRVAVKVLSGQRFGDPTSLRRFEREAQTAARLTHQNIIRVYDYGLLHDTEGAYLVMELLEGETLGSAIKRLGKIEPTRAAEWLDQALEGIKAAHEIGVLHRDLKPDNIFLARSEQQLLPPLVKILDFGLAKFTQPDVSERPSITTDGVTMGTFGYMSPEQLIGGRLDQRSDIFSFGVILAETLTGRNPFTGQNYAAFLTSVLHNTFHLSGDEPESRRLDEILQKCLAKDPDARYSSIAQLQDELIPVLKNYPVITSLGTTRRDTEAMKTSSMLELEAQTQITEEPPERGFTISG